MLAIMSNTIEHRPLRVLAVLVALGLGACDKANSSSQGSNSAKPLEVASIIAGCTTLDDCNRQCTEKTPSACVSAGRLYEFGHSVPSDPAHAFQLYEQACDWKYAGGCYNAAVLLEAGKGVEKDLIRARELYTKVCQMGSKTSCGRADTVADSKP
jgi:TPR repeat protein